MYAIAKVIGTGTEKDPYRADATPYGSCTIPIDANGKPKYDWCLVKLADYSNAVGAGLYKIPTVTNINQLSTAEATALKDKLTTIGVDTSAITPNTTMNDCVLQIGRHLDVNYNG